MSNLHRTDYQRRFLAPEATERPECACGEPIAEGETECSGCREHFEKERQRAIRNRKRGEGR